MGALFDPISWRLLEKVDTFINFKSSDSINIVVSTVTIPSGLYLNRATQDKRINMN